MLPSIWKLADKAFVPARVVKGDRSETSWLCWALVHAAVTQAAVWAPAGATGISDPAASATAAPSRQARALSFR